jgi:hypothetical protein
MSTGLSFHTSHHVIYIASPKHLSSANRTVLFLIEYNPYQSAKWFYFPFSQQRTKYQDNLTYSSLGSTNPGVEIGNVP